MLSHENQPQSLGNIRLVGGESLVSQPVASSKDSRNFFCACGNRICVYSTETGSLLRTLKGHQKDVTGFTVNSRNELQLLSCCGNGEVIVWDHTDGAILKRYNLEITLHGIYAHPVHGDSIFIVKQTPKGKRKLAVFNTKQVKDDVPTEINTLFSFTGLPSDLAFSKTGLCIAYICEKGQELGLYDMKTKQSKRCTYKDSVFTCVAFHPSMLCVATGDHTGRIVVWNGLNYDSPVTQELHWHAHQVTSLAFTHDGSYILSGGEESVLVLWQYRSHSKQFLPRLGAPISDVTCSHDDMTIAVSHTDNVVRLISGVDMNMKHTIQGLRKTSYMCKNLVFDPRTNALVMNCMPGVLQFYQPKADEGAFLVDVVKQNYISQTEDEILFFTQVQYVAFSKTGDWMATIQYRNDRTTTEETILKFWEFSSVNQSYSVNTIVDSPHGQPVVSVKFQPTSKPDEPLLAVTAGRDGRFKIWVLNQKTTITGDKHAWACQSVGYYNDTPCITSAFSEDGGLLAVAYEKVITLWRPETNELQRTLHLPFPDDRIKSLTFGCKNSSHFLIVATSQFLIVWDLLTCSVLWTIKAKVAYLLADPNTNYFAAFVVFDSKAHLYLFDPSHPNPVGVHAFVSKKSPVFTAAFDPSSPPSTQHAATEIGMSKLYFLTKSQELYTIDRLTEDQDISGPSPEVQSEDTSGSQRDEFMKMFGQENKTVSDATPGASRAARGEPASAAIRQMLSTPPHVLPPVTALCSSFLKSLLVSKHTNSEETKDADEDEMESDDDVMSDEQESDVETSAPVPTTVAHPMSLSEPMIDEDDLQSTDFAWLKGFFV